MKNRWIWPLLLAAAALAVIQVFPRVRRDNPLAAGEIQAPPEIMMILEKSCYDCHSNHTRWPWYSRLAPLSWLISHDVHNARRKMNFSAWSQIPSPSRAHYIHEIVEHVENGEMPLSRYLILPPGARVTPEALKTLRRWSEEERGNPGDS